MAKHRNGKGYARHRLIGYDYSQPGYYFITICTHERQHAFGEITNDRMHLTTSGRILEHIWSTLPNHYPNIVLDHYICMPNHFHGIIIIRKPTSISNAPQRFQQHLRTITTTPPTERPTLGQIVRHLKGASTYHIRQSGHTTFKWHTNYWDIIIRNTRHLPRFQKYITNNPTSWSRDKLHL